MAASVLFSCGLNEQSLPPFVHISEESNVDGSFMISAILGQRLRISNARTVLVCMQNNHQHYNNAGLRLGYNTNLFMDKTLFIEDLLQEIKNNFTKSCFFAKDQKITSIFLANIEKNVQRLAQEKIFTTVLIDNLSILFDLGAEKHEVVEFCQELSFFTEKYTNLTIITKLNNCDIYDDVDRCLSKLSSVHIQVEQLKSGFFRDVDGKMRIKRFGNIGPCKKEAIKKEILYKVNDRNIKIYNPGEIGIKV